MTRTGIEFMSVDAIATVHSPDESFEYHFSISGRGSDYTLWDEETDGWSRETTNYHIMVDSHLPFYIKRFDIPVYSIIDNVRTDFTLTCYAIRPYAYRSGGLAIGSGNYRIRAIVDGHYRSNMPEDSYGNRRDCSVKFDGVIICPCNGNVKSKWSSSDGGRLSFYGWDQEDPELEISDNDSYLDIAWRDDSMLQQYLNASPYDVTSKLTYPYYAIDLIIGEIVYGEAPRVDGSFGVVNIHYASGDKESSAGINFGNNPLFTGTYDEYRTYCENLVRNGS